MTDRLASKRVLITGASRGIGKAIAVACAAEGAALVLNARSEDSLKETADALRAEYGVDVVTIACDVSDRDAVSTMVDALASGGVINVLVNNAGIHKAARFLDYTPADYQDLLDVNFFGVLHMTQLILPQMIENGGGRVINMASTAGKWGSRHQSAYNVSKHAVVGLTRCLGLEMAQHNVLVNAVCPWIVDTDMADDFVAGHAAAAGVEADVLIEAWNRATPIQRNVKPEEVAGLVVYLASEESTYINGQSWNVDGGYTMI